ADDKLPYDVAPDQAGKTEVHVVCLISSLAPRMGYLESKLQDPNPAIKAPLIPVHLKMDGPAVLRQFEGAAGPETPVRIAARPSKALRNFLPPTEGGVDETGRLARFRSGLIPWDRLPPEIQDMPGEPGQRLQAVFGNPFVQLLLEPRRPRDLM